MPGLEHAVVDDRVVGVARHVEHLHAGPHRRQRLRELAAAHAGHDDVGDEQVDRLRRAGADSSSASARRPPAARV